MNKSNSQPAKLIRCAIYTRKSTEEGLDQEFNSLDSQREAAESFIASQVHEGWKALPDHYDDGGFSGGSMERPGLARLLDDVERGKIDCVVVYKVDRLSRSLLDFTKIIEAFERHGVSFVSVIRCGHCDHAMTMSFTRKPSKKVYRYYVCVGATKKGYDTCPVRTVAAGEIEEVVKRQLRAVFTSPELIERTYQAASCIS